MKKTYNWSILSTGSIAHTFAEALKFVPNAHLSAVGSRTESKAKSFAEKHGASNYYGSYEELAKDENVDIVYIASPHSFHYRDALLCLNNGKSVLCEKAFTINSAEAIKLIDLARQKKLFLMEALWTRYLPVVTKTKKMMEDGVIGEVQLLAADFGFQPAYDLKGRWFNLELGGGALLDIGIYTLSMAIYFMGMPKSWTSSAVIGESGVDIQNAMILTFNDPKIASLHSTLMAETPSEIRIVGSEGTLKLHGPVYRPTGLTVSFNDGRREYYPSELRGDGHNYQAEEVHYCLDNNRLESEDMSLSDTLRIMEIMDDLRKSWGVVYPNDLNLK